LSQSALAYQENPSLRGGTMEGTVGGIMEGTVVLLDGMIMADGCIKGCWFGRESSSTTWCSTETNQACFYKAVVAHCLSPRYFLPG
jgi:hypothetical protein